MFTVAWATRNRTIISLALVIGLTLFLMACGEAATAVPEPGPAATTAPAATAMPATTTAPAATAVPRATAAPTKAAPAPSGKKVIRSRG